MRRRRHRRRARRIAGRGALLARKFNLRIDEPRLANIAVFSHYSGVPRRPNRRRGDIRIVARPDLGWFWMIPISEELMSVGVVLPRAAFRAFQGMEHEAILERASDRADSCGRPVAFGRTARMARPAHQRWAIEQQYQELKTELVFILLQRARFAQAMGTGLGDRSPEHRQRIGKVDKRALELLATGT